MNVLYCMLVCVDFVLLYVTVTLIFDLSVSSKFRLPPMIVTLRLHVGFFSLFILAVFVIVSDDEPRSKYHTIFAPSFDLFLTMSIRLLTTLYIIFTMLSNSISYLKANNIVHYIVNILIIQNILHG